MQDNVYPEEEFIKIQSKIMGSQFPWYLQESGVSVKKSLGGSGFQFTHQLRSVDGGVSPYNDLFRDLYIRLGVMRLFRSKLNLLYRTDKIHEFQPLHIDLSDDNPPWTTVIFYINTNNGYTLFKDGTKIESIENQMVTFDGKREHCSVAQTDTDVRVNININFQIGESICY